MQHALLLLITSSSHAPHPIHLLRCPDTSDSINAEEVACPVQEVGVTEA